VEVKGEMPFEGWREKKILGRKRVTGRKRDEEKPILSLFSRGGRSLHRGAGSRKEGGQTQEATEKRRGLESGH